MGRWPKRRKCRHHSTLHSDWRSRRMGNLPSSIHTFANSFLELSIHAQPNRRLGRRRRCDDFALHCQRRNRHMESHNCQWNTGIVDSCEPNQCLHAKSHEWLGCRRHSGQRILRRWTCDHLLGWNQMVPSTDTYNSCRIKPNRSHRRYPEISLLYGAR
jgi:hypothetical protein